MELDWLERDDVLDQAEDMRNLNKRIDDFATELRDRHAAQVKACGSLPIAMCSQTRKKIRYTITNLLDDVEYIIDIIDDAATSVPDMDMSGARHALKDVENYLCEALVKEREPEYWLLFSRASDALVEAQEASRSLLSYDELFAAAERY